VVDSTGLKKITHPSFLGEKGPFSPRPILLGYNFRSHTFLPAKSFVLFFLSELSLSPRICSRRQRRHRGNALSPAARLMAAAVPPPSRGAAPAAVFSAPLAKASSPVAVDPATATTVDSAAPPLPSDGGGSKNLSASKTTIR